MRAVAPPVADPKDRIRPPPDGGLLPIDPQDGTESAAAIEPHRITSDGWNVRNETMMRGR